MGSRIETERELRLVIKKLGRRRARRLIRSSRPTEIFQPPQQGFFSVHAQLQLRGNIFRIFSQYRGSSVSTFRA
jgi:hypothetical protein